uniref:5-hydroxyisourate hydrolase n=1 Tax=Riptortus pedestris TaxID=329032 RepID=R4WKQ3_RIPPE|nr:unkown protein [Riptortus pedestris]
MEYKKLSSFSLLCIASLMAFRLQVISAHLSKEMNSRPPLTTHVLDISSGVPAANMSVSLYQFTNGKWDLLKESITNTDGRCQDLTSRGSIPSGIYKLQFQTQQYFERRNTSSFFPFVEVVFNLNSQQEHYHVPLLLSPYGYSTYRGS